MSHSKLNGHHEPDSSPEVEGADNSLPELPPLAEAPPAILELIAACTRFVETKYGAKLDFTSDTLSFVDQYVRDARADLKERPQAAVLIAAATGAYLGEVMRQSFGGFWHVEGEYDAFKLQMSTVYLAFNPIGMMMEALREVEEPGWSAHFGVEDEDRATVAEKLETIDVTEDEYFLPTTRFDTLHLLVDTLRARMEARGHGDVTFGPDDYL